MRPWFTLIPSLNSAPQPIILSRDAVENSSGGMRPQVERVQKQDAVEPRCPAAFPFSALPEGCDVVNPDLFDSPYR
jgi:hypothetical protein